jgi:hypothetical protein
MSVAQAEADFTCGNANAPDPTALLQTLYREQKRHAQDPGPSAGNQGGAVAGRSDPRPYIHVNRAIREGYREFLTAN